MSEPLRLPGLAWRARLSLTRRILAVNIFALLFMAGGFFYLDSYRTRIIDERLNRITRETILMAATLSSTDDSRRDLLVARFANLTGYRIRLYGPDGARSADSAKLGVRPDRLVDPASETIDLQAARLLDRIVDRIVFARTPPRFAEPASDSARFWPEVQQARASGQSATYYRFAPDRTPILSAAVPMQGDGSTVMAMDNARDITMTVRAERLRLSVVLAIAVMLSISLSLFLARTIVAPLRRLARAAVRVRLGRAREVIVPRLPDRRDEIGLLARAVSDMSQALRKRIDATDSFAADVSHELKNPIASLRSALEGLDRIEDPALRRQLMAIARDDVHRLDRLVTDISEASRIDALLSRTPFQSIRLDELISRLVRAREMRGIENGVKLRIECDPGGTLTITGEPQRLTSVVENLIDNAISFSPDNCTVRLSLGSDDDWAVLGVEDEGPGIASEDREAVFRRFHSVRPAEEAFGRHSGLGLAIARSVLDAHGGTITIEDRADGRSGARFVVRLPLPGDAESH